MGVLRLLNRSAPKLLIGFVACVAVLGCVALGLTSRSISNAMKGRSAQAQEAHSNPGRNALALMEFSSSDFHSLQERNGAGARR